MPTVLQAQDSPVVTLDIATGYFYEDDDDTPVEDYLGLDFTAGVLSETRNQRLSFDVGALLRATESSSDYTDPFADLSYALFNRGAELGFDLSYSEADVEDDPLPEDFDSSDITDDAGTRETSEIALRLATGRDRRFGTSTVLSFEDTTYSGTNDPDLNDVEEISAQSVWRFTVDRRVELRITSLWQNTQEEDLLNTEQTTQRLAFGGDLLFDRVWSGQFDLGYNRFEEEIDDGGGGRISTTQNGYDLLLSATRTLNNGTLLFAYTRDFDEGDALDTFQVTRALALANGGALTLSGGVVRFDSGDIGSLWGLDFEREFLRGQVVSVSLSQEGDQDDDDNDIRRTEFDASYQRELTRVSSLQLEGSLADVDQLDTPAGDTQQVSFGVTYRHMVGQDWDLVANVEREITYEDSARIDREDVFSLTLERRFSFRP